ncbi:type IV secretory system conjugative DNA transfer family protein [Spirosoma sp. RP8]|uniref:Type IV secretory system conjugative DNA transfer family protein n=1 Tax=Spirosoma liriopis TaxID=2937440 RepID=A0ABT0HV34_9BACT|nr:type IV secretory system conjugative DNA transfer family protein [Spirosoma liriopis]MCK8496068.1 type IV secretory system conjugative DNA transfer family protein [Spirosoma liriopis]
MVLFIAVFSYWIWKGIIWFIFSILGLYKSEMLGDLAQGVTPWLSFIMAIFSTWSAITSQNKAFGIGKTSNTKATGKRVRQSVYTILTTTSTILHIYITNPFRGILILGGAGAGKSKSLIEPIIQQTIQQGFAGLLYDFKFPSLAKVATEAMRTGPGQQMYYINFEHLTLSHRVNPLHPDTMPTQSHADEYAKAIMYNLKPEAIKKPDFWVDSAHTYLTALIWFLREEYPQFCTLPHVMALAFQPTADVVALLSTNPETRGTIASLRESVQRKAEGQTAGVVSTLQTALRRINTKEIVWVLSGDDFKLNLNDPENPRFLTLGNSPSLSSTFSPVLALLATVAIKQMNQTSKAPSAVILDEAPTLYIPDFEQLPATGRENKVVTVFAAQDISQIEGMYGKNKKDTILANLNNQFYGRVGQRETAQYVSDLWGMEDVEQRTQGQSESSRDSMTTRSNSIHHSYIQRNRVRIQDVLELNTGEFYGQLVESDFSSFKAQIKIPESKLLPEIVPVDQVTTDDLKQNFLRIQDEIEILFKRQGPNQSGVLEPVRHKLIASQPIKPVQSNGRANNNGHAMQPGESLDF